MDVQVETLERSTDDLGMLHFQPLPSFQPDIGGMHDVNAAHAHSKQTLFPCPFCFNIIQRQR